MIWQDVVSEVNRSIISTRSGVDTDAPSGAIPFHGEDKVINITKNTRGGLNNSLAIIKGCRTCRNVPVHRLRCGRSAGVSLIVPVIQTIFVYPILDDAHVQFPGGEVAVERRCTFLHIDCRLRPAELTD